MATPDAQDAATKARIIKHMNNDHADSIRRYLEAFKKQSFFQVRDARMTDITLEHIALECSGKQHTIPFDPPLSSLADARGRLVALDKSALQTLCRSDINLSNTSYVPPYVHLGHLINFTHGFLMWTVFCRVAKFVPGSLVYNTVLSHAPAVARAVAAIGPFYVPFIVANHLFEAGYMAAKMEKHGLNPLQATWWAWVGSCLVEGFTSFKRLDGVIEGERRRKEREGKKH